MAETVSLTEEEAIAVAETVEQLQGALVIYQTLAKIRLERAEAAEAEVARLKAGIETARRRAAAVSH